MSRVTMGYRSRMTYANHPDEPGSTGQRRGSEPGTDLGVHMPPTKVGLLVAAGICLLIPLVALMWVSSYARETPRLGGIPFFFWYQFAWVFVTSALTYTAHRLVLAARGRTRDTDEGDTLGGWREERS